MNDVDEEEDKKFKIKPLVTSRFSPCMDLVSVRMTSPSTGSFDSDFLAAALSSMLFCQLTRSRRPAVFWKQLFCTACPIVHSRAVMSLWQLTYISTSDFRAALVFCFLSSCYQSLLFGQGWYWGSCWLLLFGPLSAAAASLCRVGRWGVGGHCELGLKQTFRRPGWPFILTSNTATNKLSGIRKSIQEKKTKIFKQTDSSMAWVAFYTVSTRMFSCSIEPKMTNSQGALWIPFSLVTSW